MNLIEKLDETLKLLYEIKLGVRKVDKNLPGINEYVIQKIGLDFVQLKAVILRLHAEDLITCSEDDDYNILGISKTGIRFIQEGGYNHIHEVKILDKKIKRLTFRNAKIAIWISIFSLVVALFSFLFSIKIFG